MKNDIHVHQCTLFRRAYKRLHPNEKADVDDAITHQSQSKRCERTSKKDKRLDEYLQRPVKMMEGNDE